MIGLPEQGPVTDGGQTWERRGAGLAGLPPRPPTPKALRSVRTAGAVSGDYRITTEQLQGEVEIAYRTATTQLLVTILWASRIDAFWRRVLTGALRAAAGEGRPVRIHAFAAGAYELFRHTLRKHVARPRRRR